MLDWIIEHIYWLLGAILALWCILIVSLNGW